MKLTKENALNKLKLATATKVTAVLVESDDVLMEKNKEELHAADGFWPDSCRIKSAAGKI